jgi:hypothetical protein
MREPAVERRLQGGIIMLGLSVTFLWSGSSYSHDATPVALATEVTGLAETRVADATVAVSLLSEFAAGSRIALKKDARLTILFYASGVAYVLTGPALVRFTDGGLEALSGNEPKRIAAVTGRNGKPLELRPSRLTQAGMVARGVIRPIAARNPVGTVTLESRPAFAWVGVEPRLSYRFLLRDMNDSTVAAGDVAENSYQLPAGLRLTPGKRYRWTVRARTMDGTEYLLDRTFSVADHALRTELENFRPADHATPTSHIAFALWLEQVGLQDEARAYRQSLRQHGVTIPSERTGEP